MDVNIEKLIGKVEIITRETALSVRELFEYIAVNQQLAVTVFFVSMLVGLALRNFNTEDPTLPSIFCRGLGVVILWSMLIAFAIVFLAIAMGAIFDIVLQRDSSFQYYKFYFVKLVLGALWPSAIGLSIGMMAFIFIKRFIEPLANNFIQMGAKRSVFIDSIPQIENIQKYLFKTKCYDARKYFRKAAKNKTVFLGLDAQHKAIYVPRAHWNMCNIQIVGVPGAGKGISAAIQLYQSILNNDACVIFCPKVDEWAESVYAEACKNAGKKLIVLDCRDGKPPQINPIMGISSHDLNELLVSTFGLARQGEASDFYRNNDRKGCKIISKMANDSESIISIPRLHREAFAMLGDFAKSCDGLLTQLEEIANLSVLQTTGGIDLVDIITRGDCLLIKGSTRDESVMTLLKLILVRVTQIVDNRSDKTRHVSIFCDEIKYLLSHAFINSLGTIRDKNAHFIVAHQSLADLEVENAGLNPAAVRSTIIDNTPIKWIYRTIDFDTAKWVSELAGTKSGIDEVIESTSNSLAAENVGLNRRYHTAEIPVLHTNTIQNLPKFVGVCIGAIAAGCTLAFTSPIEVEKMEIPLHHAPADDLSGTSHGDELL
jgi:hypothetical protein